MLFISSREKFSLIGTNIYNFFKILKSKCSLLLQIGVKTVGIKQETWSESKTMTSFDKKHFLPIFARKQKFSLLENQIRPLPNFFEC